MRVSFCFVILSLLAAVCSAQGTAADPDAINLSSSMDTVLVTGTLQGPSSAVRLPDLNADGYDDLFLCYPGGPTTLRYGGQQGIANGIKARYENSAAFLVDLDGDGIQDFVSPFSIWSCWHRGRSGFPYFDSLPTGLFVDWDVDSHLTPLGVVDLNSDGVKDLVATFSSPEYYQLASWLGGRYLDTVGKTELFDSLVLNVHGYRYATIGDLGKAHDHYAIVASNSSGTGTIISINLKWPIANSVVVELANSAVDGDDGIVPISVAVMDITGDGKPDLLLGDGFYVYIFKGGDDFGSYRLTKSHAYYRIPSPRILNPKKWLDLSGFGSGIHACGDLSGSGTPYISVTAGVGGSGSVRSWTFFYAGGKALDSLYDGIVDIEATWMATYDTLHSYGAQSHSAVVFDLGDVWSNDHSDQLCIIYRDAEKLPHKPNPKLETSERIEDGSRIAAFPSIASTFTRVRASSESQTGRVRLEVRDLLGNLVFSCAAWLLPDGLTEILDLTHYVSGTYVVTLFREDAVSLSTRLIVQH